jgi:hypothetical protein
MMDLGRYGLRSGTWTRTLRRMSLKEFAKPATRIRDYLPGFALNTKTMTIVATAALSRAP